MRKFLSFVLPLFAFLILTPYFSGVFAGTLSFDPSSVNTSVGEEFTLTVVVDAGDDEILGVDALMEYDENALEVVSMTDGTYLSVGTKEYGEPGKAYAAGLVESAGESVTGSGPLVDITFKALDGGTTEIAFICRLGETGESNISENSTDATDLIDCAANGEAVIVVDGTSSDNGGDDNSGSTTGGSNTTGGSSELPQTGVFEDIVLLGMIAGGMLLLVGVGTKFIA